MRLATRIRRHGGPVLRKTLRLPRRGLGVIAGGYRPERRHRVLAVVAALAFAAAATGELFVEFGNRENTVNRADESRYIRIAFNLAEHGAFHDDLTWNPDDAWLRKEPGYAVVLLGIFSTVPDFPEVGADCVLDPQCAEGGPLRKRYRQAEVAMVATAVGGTFLAALALVRSWPLALAAGAMAVALIDSNLSGNALVGLLLLLHAGLAWRMWRRPRVATTVLAGLVLGLATLIEAVFQYWLVVMALSSALGVWWARDRRRPLALASAVMLLAAFLPAALWMLRNLAVAGQFTVSGRAGLVLAIRAEYAQATWSEVGGMIAYHLPVRSVPGGDGLRSLALEKLRPKDFGYARIGHAGSSVPGRGPDGFHRHAAKAYNDPRSPEADRSVTAERADLLAPGWRGMSAHDRDAVLARAALQLIRENWVRHLAVSVPMALWGSDHSCQYYAGLPAVRPFCGAAKLLSFAFVPLALVLLVASARRRDPALMALVLPAVGFFGFHALATHFTTRLAEPTLPLLIVIAALAAHEFVRRKNRPGGRPPTSDGARTADALPPRPE